MGLPCMDAAAKCLKEAGIKEAIVPSELYYDEDGGRSRVFDVLSALADKEKLGKLHLAPFDIVSLDGTAFKALSYADTHKKLVEIFRDEYCRPVRLEAVDSRAGVRSIFNSWVDEEGAEGLVVRSELPLIYKVKPRYSIDAAVIGFSEGAAEFRGQIRSLLLALMPEEGVYQIIGRVGGGFGDEQRKEFFERLMPMKMSSSYIETDSNHVAFHMIKPGLVVEVNINDVLFETSSGPIFNPLLQIIDGSYKRRSSVQGISVVFPVFERVREDKGANAQDVRWSQVNEINYVPMEEKGPEKELQRSELITRDVYKKEQGAKLMVQKYLVWRTNKGTQGFPEYVLSYTNFSSDRKDPLSSDVRISGDRDQIMGIYAGLLEKNIKKGWVQV
jgi:ATP-dependent DNA ligase